MQVTGSEPHGVSGVRNKLIIPGGWLDRAVSQSARHTAGPSRIAYLDHIAARVPGPAYKQQVRTLLGLRSARGPGRWLRSGHRPARARRHDHPRGYVTGVSTTRDLWWRAGVSIHLPTGGASRPRTILTTTSRPPLPTRSTTFGLSSTDLGHLDAWV